MSDKKSMVMALKNIVVPVLRSQGFKGSFPHFRRANEDNIDLLTFQFNRYGGSFVVELATCSNKGMTMSWGEKILPTKVNAHHCNDRFRLGAKSTEEDGTWFDYENASSEEDYSKVAEKVLSLLNTTDKTWISSLLG